MKMEEVEILLEEINQHADQEKATQLYYSVRDLMKSSRSTQATTMLTLAMAVEAGLLYKSPDKETMLMAFTFLVKSMSKVRTRQIGTMDGNHRRYDA